MEGQEYLNQLAASTRPMKKSKVSSILSSKLFIFGIIALAILIVTIIIGSILSGNKSDEKTLGIALKLHIDNTSSIVQTYQTNIKSSDLRSSSASLNSILSNTSRELTEYLTEVHSFDEKKVEKKVLAQAEEARDALDAELFEAKINGILDRIFAHKMTYEISVLMSEEARLINSTKNDGLTELLKTSYDSLETLYEKFNEFSETK
ncbi:hypothetical protein IKF85_00845 [Candidatus Saccharibacteria bacterium]|nr:hypothetical protein [Candidatus Saccharibacteria bacterium]